MEGRLSMGSGCRVTQDRWEHRDHQAQDPIDAEAIIPIVEHLAQLGLPIWVTEFDWAITSRAEDSYPPTDVSRPNFIYCLHF